MVSFVRICLASNRGQRADVQIEFKLVPASRQWNPVRLNLSQNFYHLLRTVIPLVQRCEVVVVQGNCLHKCHLQLSSDPGLLTTAMNDEPIASLSLNLMGVFDSVPVRRTALLHTLLAHGTNSHIPVELRPALLHIALRVPFASFLVQMPSPGIAATRGPTKPLGETSAMTLDQAIVLHAAASTLAIFPYPKEDVFTLQENGITLVCIPATFGRCLFQQIATLPVVAVCAACVINLASAMNTRVRNAVGALQHFPICIILTKDVEYTIAMASLQRMLGLPSAAHRFHTTDDAQGMPLRAISQTPSQNRPLDGLPTMGSSLQFRSTAFSNTSPLQQASITAIRGIIGNHNVKVSSLPITLNAIPKAVLSNHETRVVGQWHKKFILCATATFGLSENSRRTSIKLWCVDQHAADERWRLEKLLLPQFPGCLRSKPLGGGGFQLPPDLAQTVASNEKLQALLTSWGYVFHSTRVASSTKVTMVSVPCVDLEAFEYMIDSEESLRAVLHEATATGCSRNNIPTPFLKAAITRSCRGAIMFGTALTHGQCTHLVRQMLSVEQYDVCSHGRPSMAELCTVESTSQSKSHTRRPATTRRRAHRFL